MSVTSDPVLPERTQREVLYGVRYGDGEVEECGETPTDVDIYVRSVRLCISEGRYDADDYEPMTIVRRERITSVRETNWEPIR